MNGPEELAEDLRTFLAAGMPGALATLRARLAVADELLPDPALVTAQERDLLDLNQWPALFVVVRDMTGLRRVDGPNYAVDAGPPAEVTDAGSLTFRVRYPVRLFVFTRAHGYDVVDLQRKRYVLALRELLLAAQQATGLDVTTYTESYSDVETAGPRDRRSLAAAYIEAIFDVDEVLDGPAAVAVAETLVATYVAHPADDELE